MRFFLFSLFFCIPALAQACPLGNGETTLTLERVMRNFGRFTLPADRLAQRGTMDPAGISDQDLRDAIEALKNAESCASAVVSDRTDALLPSKVEKLSGDARAKYVQLFRDTMENFLEGLRAYETSVGVVLATAIPQRSFADVRKWSDEIEARATKAHELLQ
jgi:hypothetical protein